MRRETIPPERKNHQHQQEQSKAEDQEREQEHKKEEEQQKKIREQVSKIMAEEFEIDTTEEVTEAPVAEHENAIQNKARLRRRAERLEKEVTCKHNSSEWLSQCTQQ